MRKRSADVVQLFDARPQVGEAFVRDVIDGQDIDRTITAVIREGSTSGSRTQVGVWSIQFREAASAEKPITTVLTWIVFDPARDRWVDNLVMRHEAESRGARFAPRAYKEGTLPELEA